MNTSNNSKLQQYAELIKNIQEINEQLSQRYEEFYQSNDIDTELPKLKVMHDALKIETIAKETDNIGIFSIKQDLDHSKKLPELEGILDIHEKNYKLLQDFQDQMLNENKTFRDIFIHGPTSMAEVAVIEAAKVFMPPHELDGAVRDGLSISDVVGKINSSKIMSVNQKLSMQYHEAMKQTQQEAMTKKVELKHDLDLLSKEFGVLNSLTNTQKIEAQREVMPQDQAKGKGMGR